MNPNFFIFLSFCIIFLHFFIFLNFSNFSIFHFVSFSFIFVHFLCLFFSSFLSFSFISAFLSFSFIFKHFLSMSFNVFQCLAFSFIFFHVLSFSFIFFQFFFVGCSKSDFFWPQLLHNPRPGVPLDIPAVVQELRGPSARFHEFSHWRCGLNDAWHDSFTDLHSGTSHQFRLKLIHGLCRSNVLHERCWRGVHCWCWRDVTHCKRCCCKVCGSGRGVLDDVRKCGIGHNCCVGHGLDDWSWCSTHIQSTMGAGAA